jgi:hypothetical protein
VAFATTCAEVGAAGASEAASGNEMFNGPIFDGAFAGIAASDEERPMTIESEDIPFAAKAGCDDEEDAALSVLR